MTKRIGQNVKQNKFIRFVCCVLWRKECEDMICVLHRIEYIYLSLQKLLIGDVIMDLKKLKFTKKVKFYDFFFGEIWKTYQFLPFRENCAAHFELTCSAHILSTLSLLDSLLGLIFKRKVLYFFDNFGWYFLVLKANITQFRESVSWRFESVSQEFIFEPYFRRKKGRGLSSRT